MGRARFRGKPGAGSGHPSLYAMQTPPPEPRVSPASAPVSASRGGKPKSGFLPRLSVDAALRAAMTRLLHDVQAGYPRPKGAFWVPRRLGGSAPTPEQAKILDAEELAERARRRAERP